jgi:growth hormone-inducible transmembrane protein
MAFVLKRPFAASAAIKQFSKPSSVIRAFHSSSPLKSAPQNHLTSKATAPAANALKSNSTFQNVFRRAYQSQGYQGYNPAQTGNLTQRLLYGGLMVGGAMLAANLIFNRETREDGGMPLYEREYLNQTFMHTGLGLGIIGLAARTLHASGWSYRLMATSPWVMVIGGLAASIGTMYGTLNTHPDK